MAVAHVVGFSFGRMIVSQDGSTQREADTFAAFC